MTDIAVFLALITSTDHVGTVEEINALSIFHVIHKHTPLSPFVSNFAKQFLHEMPSLILSSRMDDHNSNIS